MNHCFYSKSILDLNNLLKSFFIYQCSQRASTHFYQKELTYITHMVLCQCPQRASTHFYGSLSEALILLASES